MLHVNGNFATNLYLSSVNLQIYVLRKMEIEEVYSNRFFFFFKKITDLLIINDEKVLIVFRCSYANLQVFAMVNIFYKKCKT